MFKGRKMLMSYIRGFLYQNYQIGITICLVLFLLAACTKSDQGGSVPKGPKSSAAVITNFNLFPGLDTVNISTATRTVQIRTLDSVTSVGQVAAIFSLSAGASAAINTIPQTSGITKNDFDQDIPYTITAADQTTQQIWTIQVSNNDHTDVWGMGHFLSKIKSLDRSYRWYIDQGTTGPDNTVNCGPSSVTMAIKWSDSTFSKTAADARSTYEEDGGWWFTTDIENYLTKYVVSHVILPLSGESDSTKNIMMHELDNQEILLLCVDMGQVRAANSTAFHVDRFYGAAPNWGHFIVVKGYQVIDQQVYFDVYDPYSLGQAYDNGKLKGLDRFYRYQDIFAATYNWWNFAFVIAAKGNSVTTNALHGAVDPLSIKNAHGM